MKVIQNVTTATPNTVGDKDLVPGKVHLTKLIANKIRTAMCQGTSQRSDEYTSLGLVSDHARQQAKNAEFTFLIKISKEVVKEMGDMLIVCEEPTNIIMEVGKTTTQAIDATLVQINRVREMLASKEVMVEGLVRAPHVWESDEDIEVAYSNVNHFLKGAHDTSPRPVKHFCHLS